MSFLSSLFGGGSKSSSTNAPVTDTKNNNIQSNTAPVNISSGPQTITTTTTDSGAVAGALDLANKSLGTVQATVTDLAHTEGQNTLDIIRAYTSANEKSFSKTLDAATQQNNSLRDFVQTATQSDQRAITDNLIKYGAVALVAVAFIAVRR